MINTEVDYVLNEIPGIEHVRDNIVTILSTTSASIYWKDKNGVYLGANQVFLDLSLLKTHKALLGKKDRELMWEEQAPILERNDKEIMYSHVSRTYIEPVKCNVKQKVEHFLSHKIPLKTDKGKIIGLVGLSLLFENELPVTKPVNFADHFNIKMTAKQLDCLHYLSKGMATKQIAAKMHLSVRTVEHHLERIKRKLNCKTRAELLFKAAQLL